MSESFLPNAMSELPESILPDTMSALLSVAIKDAESLDRYIYKPHYEVWHHSTTRRVSVGNNRVTSRHECTVCLAGAVIAGTLRTSRFVNYTTDTLKHFGDMTYHKLTAIDWMRDGSFFNAAQCLDIIPATTHRVALERANKVVCHKNFSGWERFDKHLKSLKKARDILQDAGL